MELIKIFLIVIALIVLIHMIPSNDNSIDSTPDGDVIENMDANYTAESIQNIASLYNDKTPSFTTLTVSDTGILKNAQIDDLDITPKFSMNGKNFNQSTNSDTNMKIMSLPKTWTTYPRSHAKLEYNNGDRVCPAGSYMAGLKIRRALYDTSYDQFTVVCRPFFA